MTAGSGAVVVVGGYGAVGHATAEMLAEWFPGRVLVAGRDPARAARAADAIGRGTTWRQVDVTSAADRARLSADAALVVMAVERANVAVAQEAVRRGVHYVDVTASPQLLRPLTDLDQLAVRTGSTVALSVGVAPGLTNLLADECLRELPAADTVELTLMLGTGDPHGRDSVRWIVEQAATASVGTAGAGVGGGTDVGRPRRTRVDLPGVGRRAVFPFPFSDQHVLTARHGVRATTRMCLDSRVLTWTLFAGRSSGLFRLARRLRLDDVLVSALVWARVGADRFVVRASASRSSGPAVTRAVAGRGTSQVTGAVAAVVARQVLTGGTGTPARVSAGVRHIDQVTGLADLVAELSRHGVMLE
ncbi:saccharopine dehydrogenase NADP-binding domain-containing protein [Micromonospora sp. Llam0]|uniref:saccharopine dehydrogenase NADP-binding domain-containing protein n=1 Tax=Micromonospora sp. Llam0 TaxID=2485143 RepID=UPI0013156401|nr:saccharopine dehydrogenase NADP-binding domain-containing protein [Micromonospora sp. Llam0]